MEKEKQLLSLAISPDLNKVKVKFAEVFTAEIVDDAPEDAENEIKKRYFSTTSYDRPHKDMTGSMKKLRKHCLAMIGLELADESKQLAEFAVSGIKMKGDLLMKQSRIQIIFGKKVELTGGIVEMKTGWFEMYPTDESKSKYVDMDKVANIVEDIAEEVWSYLFDGKFEEVVDPQLALFPNQSRLEKAA